MKELSIEEKAKACDSNYKVYTELINRLEDIKEAIKKQNYGIAMDVLCKPYPEFQVTTHSELKDGKGEKIRNFLIKQANSVLDSITDDDEEVPAWKSALAWLEKQGNLMKALQISNAKIGELIEENYYLKEQLEKQGKNNMGISEATKKKLEDNLNKALEKETPESWNKFLDEQGEQKPAEEYNITGIGSKHATGKLAEKIKELESLKQSEQKPIKEHNACEFCEDRYGCVSPCSMKLIEEEKSADKVEPKFKIEEEKWYVCTQTFVLRGKIVVIKGQTYQAEKDNVIKGEDGCLFIDKHDGKASDYFRLWTIQDAKDGDVLEFGDHGRLVVGIVSYVNKTTGKVDVNCLLENNNFKVGNYYNLDTIKPHPATQEQYDLLFQKMKEAGYEWDAEKKELKKVEKKKDIHNKLTAFEFSLKHIIEEAIECGDIRNLKNDADMLLRLVQKSTWSEEDENILDAITYTVKNSGYKHCIGVSNEMMITFIESLKERYTWKPSDEQMLAINTAINVLGKGTINGKYLIELHEQLKKLKG